MPGTRRAEAAPRSARAPSAGRTRAPSGRSGSCRGRTPSWSITCPTGPSSASDRARGVAAPGGGLDEHARDRRRSALRSVLRRPPAPPDGLRLVLRRARRLFGTGVTGRPAPIGGSGAADRRRPSARDDHRSGSERRRSARRVDGVRAGGWSVAAVRSRRSDGASASARGRRAGATSSTARTRASTRDDAGDGREPRALAHRRPGRARTSSGSVRAIDRSAKASRAGAQGEAGERHPYPPPRLHEVDPIPASTWSPSHRRGSR